MEESLENFDEGQFMLLGQENGEGCYEEFNACPNPHRRVSLFDLKADVRFERRDSTFAIIHEDQPKSEPGISKPGVAYRKQLQHRRSLYNLSTKRRSLGVLGLLGKEVRNDPPRISPQTYQLLPRHRFDTFLAEKVMMDTFEMCLKEEAKLMVPYEDSRAKRRCLQIANKIREAAKLLAFDRYRIIAYVLMFDKRHHPNVLLGSRCLWHPGTDTYAQVRYQCKQLTVVGTLYGIYKE